MAHSANLLKIPKIGHLACKLAQFSFFCEDVLRASLPLVKRDLPALPGSGIDKLKEVLLDQFPHYRRNLVEFEELWEEYVLSMQHLCMRLRRKLNIFLYLLYVLLFN